MNKVILGDCIDVLPTLPKDSVDLIIADPPYGNVVNEKWDKIEDYFVFSENWLAGAYYVLKPTGSIYVWCSIGPKSSSLIDIACILQEKWYFQDMIVWKKQRGRGNRKGWLFTREEILWATKSEKDYVWNKENQYTEEMYHPAWIERLKRQDNPYKRATNVWTDIDEVTIEMAKNSGAKGKRSSLHIAQKPVKAIERIIKAHTKENDLVLDCFAGSGVTGVIAKKLNRNYILIEKDEESYKQICLRIEHG